MNSSLFVHFLSRLDADAMRRRRTRRMCVSRSLY